MKNLLITGGTGLVGSSFDSGIKLGSDDLNLLDRVKDNFDKLTDCIHNQDLNFYMNFVVESLFAANKYFNDQEPWNKKSDTIRLNTIVYVSLELINPKFYHLDTCLFVSDNHICFYKDAFTPESLNMALTKLTQYVAENELSVKITSVSSKHAESFICNSIAIKDKIITPASDFSGVFDRAAVCDMSEFMKSGGAIKCLTLKL